MGWRVVVIKNKAHLNYRDEYMLVRNEEIKAIHLSEISFLMIENQMTTISSYLLVQLAKKKIPVVFCDEQHNPSVEALSLYSSYNNYKKINIQTSWIDSTKEELWSLIIKNKINNQASLLHKYQKENIDKLKELSLEVSLNDTSNREGHAAKVYFFSLFKGFKGRKSDDDTNRALDYGYSILLAAFNREIVNQGYLTQLGIKHKGEFNHFNLSSDLMEVFRPVIDEIVLENINNKFDKDYKLLLVDGLNKKVKIDYKEYYVLDAISIYLRNIFNCLEHNDLNHYAPLELL